MKKPVFLFLICLLSGIASAQSIKGGYVRVSPTVNNSSIRRSVREQAAQTKNFATQRRYSSAVRGRGFHPFGRRGRAATAAPDGSGL
jgi:hypothetical protein